VTASDPTAAASDPADPGPALSFRRRSPEPLLGLSAVPWCAADRRPRPSIMFPTVVDMDAASGLLGGAPAALDRFQMYFAPHSSTGIGLASAPRPEGPWTPYPHNPILRLQQFPGLNDHLSSPELVLRPDHPNAPFWLYVHGRTGPRAEGFGQHTCVATSRDAVAWEPLGPDPVLTATAGQSGHKNSAAYVRLFQRHGWQYALYKAETVHSLARSRDGLAWEHWPHNPLLVPDPGAGDRNMIRHTGLLPLGDSLLIFYSSGPDRDDPHGREEIKLATLDVSRADWLGWGGLRRRGPVLTPEQEWEAGDVRDPFPLVQGDTLYLYYVGGHERGIGLAWAPLDALRGIAP
jgi:hypothetical protein